MKTYQRILASIGIVLLSTLLVLSMLLCLVRSSKIQTAAVALVAEQLSQGLNTRVGVGELNYQFPNELLIHNVLLEDQQADTLLYVDTLSARADLWQLLAHNTLLINDVTLSGARSHIYDTDPDSARVMNYQFLIDAFRTDTERDTTPLAINIQIDRIRLARLSAQYDEMEVRVPATIIRLQNLSHAHFEAEIESCSATIDRHQPGCRPLDIRRLEAHAIVSDSLFSFPKLHIQLPRTDIDATELFIDHGIISVQVEEATITPSDLATILPAIRSMNAPWSFCTAINGNIDSLNASHLHLQYRHQDIFRGDLTVLRLPTLYEKLSSLSFPTTDSLLTDMDSTMLEGARDYDDQPYVRAHCEDFIISKATLQDIISSTQGRPVALPDMLTRLGQVHYKGAIEGRLNDLQLRGAFTSSLGSIRTDGWASIAKDFSEFNYLGLLSTKRFQLGRLLGVNDLGTVGFTIHSNGHIGAGEGFDGTIRANLNHLDYKQYTYQNIYLHGTFFDKHFNGQMHSNDPNIAFSLDSKVSFLENKETDYNISFVLKHLHLNQLHLTDRFEDNDFRFRLNAQARGTHLDSLEAKLTIQDLCFTRPLLNDSLVLNEFSFVMSPHARPQSIHLASDYVNASVKGHYALSTLPVSIQKMVAAAMPSLFSHEQQTRLRQAAPANQLEFYVFARHLDHVSRLLGLPFSIPDMPTVKGSLIDKTSEMSLRVVVPELRINNTHLESIALSVNADKEHQWHSSLFAMLYHGKTPAAQKMGDMQFLINADAARDVLDLTASWANPDSIHNAGDLHVNTRFARYANQPFITANIQPTDVIVADSLWQFHPSTITYTAADTIVSIDHFMLGSNTQSIFVDGVASTRMKDTLSVDLKAVDLDYILSAITDIRKSIYFGGQVTGWARAYGILRAPMFEAEVAMPNAEINGSLLGDVFASATLDSLNHVIINGDVYDHRLASSAYKPTVHVDGVVGGPNGYWNLDIYPDSVELGFVNFWTDAFLSDIHGRASGQVRVWGMKEPHQDKGGTWVRVRAKAHDGSLTVPFTGGTYIINDSVFMDSTSLTFPPMVARDLEGNPVDVSGLITHDGSFKNMHYQIDATPHRAIVLDLPTNGENLYSGHVYANGKAAIFGDDKACHIAADATTTGGKFVFSIGGASTATESSFIEFVQHTKACEEPDDEDYIPSVKSSSFDLTLQVEVTPVVDVSVLLDHRTGDAIKGQGDGNIRLNIVNDKISMLGSLSLLRGSLGFTFQNVIHRDFQIAEGSSVTWSGVPENPELNVQALYKVSASLRDLFGADATTVTSRSTIPVHCVLNVTDRLSSPLIRFGIDLPTSDESVAAEVRSVINTEEMLTRQVLYLLIFSRFYTPEYVEQKGTVGVNETYSLISSTITGQINSWISRLTDMVSFGFNVRSEGQGADAAQEYEAQFEFHPVRGLMINGNLGYRYNDISNQPVFGNLDVEYALTNDGKFRIKGYTHTVDKYSLRQASTIQGIGFVFKHDFNWDDAKKRKAKKAEKNKK